MPKHSLLLLITRFTDLNFENKDFLSCEDLSIYKKIYDVNIKIKNIPSKRQEEKKYHEAVVLNFKDIFPKYEYIEKEYKLPDGDQVDILAKEQEKSRPVIIELKVTKESAHRQLRSYACNFINPILINLSREMPYKEVKGIIYKIWDNRRYINATI